MIQGSGTHFSLSGPKAALQEEAKRMEHMACSQGAIDAAAAADELRPRLEASQSAMKQAMQRAMQQELTEASATSAEQLNESRVAMQKELVKLAAQATTELDRGAAAASRIAQQAMQERELAGQAASRALERVARLETELLRTSPSAVE